MYDIDYYNSLAKQLMFELNDEEAEDVKKRFEVFFQQLELLEEIDTTGIEPMVYPFEEGITYLREDDVVYTLTQEEILKNAPKEKQGHFVVPKVVK
ncbi:MAG: Asp-tRNA(Asn)/Glu-tRNA(Gln) amidotransferase subunit GatC [Erysipelotrichaceae bacterium]